MDKRKRIRGRRSHEIQRSEWIAPSDMFNYVMDDPLIDWLKMYEKSDNNQYTNYIMESGHKFESVILEHFKTIFTTDKIVQVCDGRDDTYDRRNFEKTKQLMMNKTPIIYQGLLMDEEEKLFGCPDFLIRSDCIPHITEQSGISDERIAIPAKELGVAVHYRVVDVKNSCMHLNADGCSLRNEGIKKFQKAQIIFYNNLLGKIQGYTPAKCYVYGCGYKYENKDGYFQSNSCDELLGCIYPRDRDSMYQDKIENAIKWIRHLRTDGQKERVLPQPTCPELYPNMCNTYDNAWRKRKREIAEKIDEISLVYYCGVKQRRNAHAAGVYRWTDPACNAEVLGIGGKILSGKINKMLEFNRETDNDVVYNIPVIPSDGKIPVYIDFETVYCPEVSRLHNRSAVYIFMIGVGYYRNDTEWVYYDFTIKDKPCKKSEQRIVKDFLDKLKQIGGGKISNCVCLHWGGAEQYAYEKVLDRCTKNIKIPEFLDLCGILRQQNVFVKGSFGFSLKNYANALYKHGEIEHGAGDDCLDGFDAMCKAYSVYFDNNTENKKEIMDSIIRYNELDCLLVAEIHNYMLSLEYESDGSDC